MNSPKRQRPGKVDPSEAGSDLVGLEFEGRYQIKGRIGQGGIGVVYRAVDKRLSRQVAVKVLLEAAGMRQSQRRRFEREAEALSAVSHPNVVTVLDYGVADGTPYLVMELLEGESLADLLSREAPLDSQRAMGVMSQLLLALRYVHERGVVHRDLKPGNIFMQVQKAGTTQVKLLDFGLAKFLGPADGEGEGERVQAAPTLTRSGEIFGTPGYMPAEQMLGKPVDATADVYSAGVILYEMLAGVRPYQGDMVEVVQRQLAGEVPRLVDAGSGREGHPDLEAFLARCLCLNPEERFRDAVELSAAFDALPIDCVQQQSPEARAEMLRARHEASTRVGVKASTQAPTVVSDKELAATARLASPAKPSRPSKASKEVERGSLARVALGLVALGKGALRASAWLVVSVSVLMIVGAGVIIYVFSQPDLERERALLRRALPANASKGLGAMTPAGSAGNEPKDGVPAAQDAPDETSKAQTTSLPPARNPWGRRTPAALRRIRTIVTKGQSANEKTVRYLQGYNRAHPEDARGHLLLGGLYMNRGWYSDGVQQYKLAFAADPSTRGDTRAASDLLKLASGPQDVWLEAEAVLRTVYGREIQDDIVRAAGRTSEPEARERLMQLSAHTSN